MSEQKAFEIVRGDAGWWIETPAGKVFVADTSLSDLRNALEWLVLYSAYRETGDTVIDAEVDGD